ncbi:trace amine-associated receptor 1-like [Ostrea edulis]|uniref:trace amine-associated receptor 1-like n=1 Tax=Ostrea edulis TaxID=37623 RepID=UPI0020958032|nr:trace amine-associated receptor 1-like [Ostrea edulis]XP_048764292.1 trace amine-associated receptor 1-like [Ostrea edulis]XP_048764293.1 trace amine-associated receptor 1-like [Ostrea edulis]XP_048764294.1 trace amine-associated receptor 1-like [Ostrea edulis]
MDLSTVYNEIDDILREDIMNGTVNFKSRDEQNQDAAYQRMPTVIFLGLLIFVGVVGNIIVLVVYTLKYPSTTFKFYILALAVIDLLTCCISMPFEIADNVLPFMFFNETVCQVGRFLGNVFKIAAAFIIVVMAIGRYKKICHPFSRSTTISQARFAFIASIVLACVFSWPTLFIQGIRERKLNFNITGYDCTINSDIAHTNYPFVFSTVLFTVYAIVFLALAILYSLVIYTLNKHAKEQEQFEFNDNIRKSNPRITKMMIAITVGFIVCYIPNCILDAISTFKHGYVAPPSPIVLATLPLIARTFFINNVINPFIYLFGDPKFRNIIKQCTRWLFYTICRPGQKRLKDFTVAETMHLTDVKHTTSHS